MYVRELSQKDDHNNAAFTFITTVKIKITVGSDSNMTYPMSTLADTGGATNFISSVFFEIAIM